MRPQLRAAVTIGLMVAVTAAGPTSAQKAGGIVRFPILDNPASEGLEPCKRVCLVPETGCEPTDQD